MPSVPQPRNSNSEGGTYVGSDGSEAELLRDVKLLVRAMTFHLLAAGGRLVNMNWPEGRGLNTSDIVDCG